MERAGRLIGKLKFSESFGSPEARALAAWKVAAGPKVARYTEAISLVRNTLVVEVEDKLWQKNLLTLQHFLLKNLADVLGEPLVTDLDLRPMAKRKTPQRAETARPLEGIEDPVLELIYRQARKKETA